MIHLVGSGPALGLQLLHLLLGQVCVEWWHEGCQLLWQDTHFIEAGGSEN